jgi:Fic family protein
MPSAAHPASRWPPHEQRTCPWPQTHRGGGREDRMRREVTVSLPPMIARQGVYIDASLAADLESAMREITALDTAHGTQLAALGMLLLRTESVASSKIEAVEASLDDYARALHGIRTNPSAVSMAAATVALATMMDDVARTGRIERTSLTSAHRVLMQDDPVEVRYAGRLRDMQNWIGGSNHSPRGALYVPPPPDTVDAYLDDLLSFANRNDLPALVQAALAHAQFESIHPFTDGNGRIGRALINAVLRRRGATTSVVVPLASALVARRNHYFELLNSYRRGDIEPLLTTFATSARSAATESRHTAARLNDITDEWREMVGVVRSGSAVAKLLAVLPTRPILSAEDARTLVDAPRSSVFAAINRLSETGVLRGLTDRTRNQVWGASLILDELDDLGLRIAQSSSGI